MKNNPSKQSQAARERMDAQDAHRKVTALIRKIGDRQPTATELATLESLRGKS
jgi:hypothetical protein